MFRYLVAREVQGQHNAIASLMVMGNTISLYPQFGTPITNHFQDCVKEFGSNPGHVASFSDHAEALHGTSHSSDPGEQKVTHYHLRHGHANNGARIKLQDMKNMLDDLTKCESTKTLPNGQTFLTHTVRKDILRHFKTYSKTKKDKPYIASNSAYYNKMAKENVPMPTIAEHDKCMHVHKYLDCGPDNYKSPQRMLAPENRSYVDIDPEILGATVMLALTVGVGLFAYRKSKKTSQRPKHAAVIIKKMRTCGAG